MRDLFIDLTNQRLAASTTNLSPTGTPSFVRGDTGTINLYFLVATGNISAPFSVVDKSTATIELGIGDLQATPQSGTFKLSYSAQTTGALSYSATAGAISTALNALSTISSAGGVEVTGDAAGHATVQFRSAGTRSAITANTTLLLPDTTATISVRRTGSATQAEIQDLDLMVSPYVAQSIWASSGTIVTASVSTIVTGSPTSNDQQKVVFSREPSSGAFTLSLPTFNAQISSAVTNGLFVTTGRHGLSLFQPIVLTGFTSISGYTQGTNYFVRSIPAGNQFYLATSSNGSAITLGEATITTGSVAVTQPETSSPLAYNATPTQVQTALQSVTAIGANNCTVLGQAGSFYDIYFVGDKSLFDVPKLTISSSVAGNPIQSASVDFGGLNLRDAMASSSSIGLTLELQLTESGNRTTVIQQGCTILEQLIIP